MLYGVLIAIPIAVLAGPVLARVVAPGIRLTEPVLSDPVTDLVAPSHSRALFIVLLPIVLIASGKLGKLIPGLEGSVVLAAVANPELALLITNLLALTLLFGRHISEAATQESIWHETMGAAGAILLAIGAGGALRQVLVSAGLSNLLARVVMMDSISPMLLGWLVAVGIPLAAGSATVETITAVGVMPGVVAASEPSPRAGRASDRCGIGVLQPRQRSGVLAG